MSRHPSITQTTIQTLLQVRASQQLRVHHADVVKTAHDLACQRSLDSSPKRKRSVVASEDVVALFQDPPSEGCRRSSKKRKQLVQSLSRNQTMYTHRRFEQRNIFLPRSMYVGLCTYLYTLIKWNWIISECQFDNFITQYHRYLQEFPFGDSSCPSYHHWFEERPGLAGLQTGQPSNNTPTQQSIMTLDILNNIAVENPFSVCSTEMSFRCAISRINTTEATGL